SARWQEGACITATGAMLGRLTRERFVEVDSRGHPASRGDAPAPSSDTAIHLAVYRSVPDAHAVVHAHPVHAIARSLEWGALTPANLEGELFIGRVPVLEVEWESSAEPVAAALVDHPVVLTRAHGAYARGRDAWEALKFISILEESAAILYLSDQDF
ncbi:MAG: class II aldolase/adducin family protein, partial [Dehalococcoidia bacterium]